MMLEAAKAVATRASAKPTTAAQELAKETIGKQVARLKDLATRNPAISKAEIKALETGAKETEEVLKQARVRLDSLRLIYCQ